MKSINRLNALLLIVILSLTTALSQQPAPAITKPATLAELQERITELFDQPKFASARWGARIITTDGRIIFERDADKAFMPASNMKLYTTAAALDAFGGIDVAFANAGFGAARGFLESTPEHWRSMVLTNVYGCALTIRATMPALKESKGHLVLTSSVAGRRALPGSLYSATKHAVTAMGEAARLDYNDSGVRVTLIEPGMVDTPFFDNPPKIRALDADDVARTVMFAVSQPPHVDVNEILLRPTAQPT